MGFFKIRLLLPAILIILIGLFAYYIAYEKSPYKLNYTNFEGEHIMWSESSGSHYTDAKFQRYAGTDTWSFDVKKHNKVKFSFKSNISSGDFSMVITDSSNNILATLSPNTKDTIKLTAKKDDIWNITTTGKDAAGNFMFTVR